MFASKSFNNEKMKRIVLSTGGVNRYGYRVLTNGINLEAFKKNPVMFFGHCTNGFPIGVWEDIKVEGDVLSAVPKFSEVTEDSKLAKMLYEKGILQASSIGFSVTSSSDDPALAIAGQRYETITACELLEVSLVGVPANPDSTVVSLNLNLNKDIPLLPIKSDTDMDIKVIALSLGLDQNATEAQVLAAIEGIKQQKNDGILQLGIDKGVVDDSNKTIYEKAIANDPETWKLHFETLPQKVVVETTTAPASLMTPMLHKTLAQKTAEARTATIVPTNNLEGGRDKWTYLQWQENDSAGLRELRMKSPKQYDDLVTAHLVD